MLFLAALLLWLAHRQTIGTREVMWVSYDHNLALLTRLLVLALAGYGATLVFENPPVIMMRMAVWALVAVAVHDVVFARLEPVVVAVVLFGEPDLRVGRRQRPAGELFERNGVVGVDFEFQAG